MPHGSKKAAAKRNGLTCTSACLGLGVALLALAVGPVKSLVAEVLFLNFLRIRYAYEGIPWREAWKDALYFYDGIGRSPSLLSAPYFKEMGDIYSRKLLHVQPGDDHITAMCKVSMYTQMVTSSTWEGTSPLMPPGFFNLDTHDPVPTQERVNSYLQACVDVYSSLDKDGPQRKILDALAPEIKAEISTPKLAPANPQLLETGKLARHQAAAGRPSHAHLWKDASEFPEYGFMYESSKVRPVREEVIDASEIGEAIRQGRVAKFDATKLLGKEIFNMSMPEIAALHADTADQIPMYRQKGATAPGRSGVDTLENYARRVKAWKEENAIRFPEHAPWRAGGVVTPRDTADWKDADKQPTWWLEALAWLLNLWMLPVERTPIQLWLRYARSHALQCAVNTRRLPKLPVPKIEDALGNPDWLERAWTMLWLGPIGDCWHYDDPDNLVIGIYGEIWVTVFQLKDRELLRGNGDRGCWSGLAPMPSRIDTLQVAQEEAWLEKFQFVHFKLTPGTGVTIPSGAFHSLTMTDGDRILMNCFMVPKYKGLWDAPAANYSFYSDRWQTEEYHALSQLKKSSIFRLWDTKKLGGYFEGAKLEML